MFTKSKLLTQDKEEVQQTKSSSRSLLKTGVLAAGVLAGCYATCSYLGQPSADVPNVDVAALMENPQIDAEDPVLLYADELEEDSTELVNETRSGPKIDPRRMFNTEESEWCFEDLRNYKDEFNIKRDIFGCIIKWKS